MEQQRVQVRQPELSQAFYAALEGSPDLYRIDQPEKFELYLNLLVPDLPQAARDFRAEVLRLNSAGNEESLFTLDGREHTWEKYFEPFAGDRYLKGPEHTQTLPAGQYKIQVSSPDNRGKYVLAVGREERFTAKETLSMIAALPALKRDFFEKSPLTAYFNLMGLFMLLSLSLLLAAAAGIYLLIRYALKPHNS